MLKTKLFLGIILLSSTFVAVASIEPCKELVVYGDQDWAPYFYPESNSKIGAADYAIDKIFQDLDIPVKRKKLKSKWELVSGMRRGTIDVVLASYKFKELEEFTDLLEPSFSLDSIVVAVNKGGVLEKDVHNWMDLLGQRGLKSLFLDLDSEFLNFAAQYLYVKQTSSIAKALNLLKEKKIDYVIGGFMQLNHALVENNLHKKIVILEQPQYKANVYMAFSKESNCKAYSNYVNSRLQIMKAEGELAKMIYDNSSDYMF